MKDPVMIIDELRKFGGGSGNNPKWSCSFGKDRGESVDKTERFENRQYMWHKRDQHVKNYFEAN